jgi:pyruvate/2-oxoglutarate dehydrogenase complex dihydrolipoamide dehydrogenase (E3) component
MTAMQHFDVFVIGGGGTGSEIVGRLSARGNLRVGMAERDRLGGECNWYGCVPSKIMLRSAKVASLARKAARFGVEISDVRVDFPAVRARVRRIVGSNTAAGARPFEEKGARVICEEVRVTGPNELETASGERLTAERIVFASGTEAAIPPIDGLRDGPHWTNKEAIWHEGDVPSSLAIIGAGPIGVEFAQIYARFGAEVTVLEAADRIMPPEDADSSAPLAEALEADGIDIVTGARISRADHADGMWTVGFEGRPSLQAEQLLVATGRTPVFDGHDLEAIGMELDEKGRPVLDGTLRTTAEGVWAAGDATGDLLFVHVGGYEAGIVIDDILGAPRQRDYRVVPRVTYTDPEVASVGLTEADAREEHDAITTSLVRFEDNERARMEGAPAGHVKLVADARTGELLGGHIVGDGAGEMIHEIALAMQGAVTARTGAATIHAYPTLSETVRGAFSALQEEIGTR